MRSVAELPPVMDGDVYFDKPASDLSFRTLEQSEFEAQLQLEAPCRPFLYTRKFVVASRPKYKLRTIESRCEHPQHIERDLSKPDDRVMLKLLDIIEIRPLTAPNASPKYSVRVRWSSGPNTWMDMNMIPYQRAALLQQLLVGTVHSWRLIRLIKYSSWKEYKTELELWSKDPAARAYLTQSPAATTSADDAEESKGDLSDNDTPSKRQKRSHHKPIRYPLPEPNSVADPPSHEKRNQRRRSRNFADVNNGNGIRLSTLVPGASNDIVVITLVDDSEEEKESSALDFSSEQGAPDQSTATEQGEHIGSSSTAQAASPLEQNAGENGQEAIVEQAPAKTLEPSQSSGGNSGTGTTATEEDINQDMDEEIPMESPNIPSSESWSPGSAQEQLSESSEYNEDSEASSPDRVRSHKKQNIRQPPANLAPAQGEAKPVIKDDTNCTTASLSETMEKVEPKELDAKASSHQKLESDEQESKPVTSQPTDQSPSVDVKKLAQGSTDIVNRKKTLWAPLLPPKPNVACPCGVVQRLRAFKNWVVCHTKGCNTWMHRACVQPGSFYCQKCTGKTEMSTRVLNCAVWQLSALNDAEHLAQVIRGPAFRKVDINFRYHSLSYLSVAVVTGSTKTFALLIRIPKFGQANAHVDPFNKNLLHLAVENRQYAIAEFLIKNMPTLLVPCNIYKQSAMHILVKSFPLLVQGFLEKYLNICRIIDQSKNNWAHYVCKFLPTNFFELLKNLPRDLFMQFNESDTPLMLACQNPNIQAAHIAALQTPLSIWGLYGPNGYTAAHYLIKHDHARYLKCIPVVVHQVPNLYTCAILNDKVEAIETLIDMNVPVNRPQMGTGLWPIAMVNNGALARVLLKVETLAQLQYLVDTLETTGAANHHSISKLFLNYQPLYTYVNELVEKDINMVKLPFFQFFRIVLRLDYKHSQLLMYLAKFTNINAAASLVQCTSVGTLWNDLCRNYAKVMNWRAPIQFRFLDGMVLSTTQDSTWSFIWQHLQLPGLLDNILQNPMQMTVFGLLLGHMVCMKGALPEPTIPNQLLHNLFQAPPSPLDGVNKHPTNPKFVQWTESAQHFSCLSRFRLALNQVLSGWLAGWTAPELSVLLHSLSRKNFDVLAWQRNAHYDASVLQPTTKVLLEWWWRFVLTLKPMELIMVWNQVGDSDYTIACCAADQPAEICACRIVLPCADSFEVLADLCSTTIRAKLT